MNHKTIKHQRNIAHIQEITLDKLANIGFVYREAKPRGSFKSLRLLSRAMREALEYATL